MFNYHVQCILVFLWESIIFFLCHRLGKTSFYNIHAFIHLVHPMFHGAHTFIHLIYTGAHALNFVMYLRGLTTDLRQSSSKL